MQRLHSEIDPAYFSTKFRPMSHLVRVLSAEAKQRERLSARQSNDESDAESEVSTDDENCVRLITLEGRVVKVTGLDAKSTVAELRTAVAEQTGASMAETRLYVDAGDGRRKALGDAASSSRLELLADSGRTLEDVYGAGAVVHMRNREYEALRTQLNVATEVVEDVLDRHYADFLADADAAVSAADRLDAYAVAVKEARALVASARTDLGLPRRPGPDDNPGGPLETHDHDALKVTAVWEHMLQAEEALRLLEQLEARCLQQHQHSASRTSPPP